LAGLISPQVSATEKWCSCIDGALTKENYLESIRKGGFTNVEVLEEKLYHMQEEEENKLKIMMMEEKSPV
jgi:hypothetical protein